MTTVLDRGRPDPPSGRRSNPGRPTAVPTGRCWWLLVALVAGCGTPPVQAPPGEAPALRVVSYNIRHGRGMDNEVNLDRTAAVLRRLHPDIVGLQEVDSVVERSGRVAEAQALGERLGMQHAFGGFMAYQGGQYGMGILSRFPIRMVRSVRLPDGNEPRIALAVQVDAPAIGPLMVVNVHFDWVASDSFRIVQATALTRFLDSLPIPYILLGDFNDEPGSRTLGLFHSRAREAAKPAGNRSTFSSTEPVKEIDFIFGAPAARWRADSVTVIAEPVASDHRPIFARLHWR